MSLLLRSSFISVTTTDHTDLHAIDVAHKIFTPESTKRMVWNNRQNLTRFPLCMIMSDFFSHKPIK